MMHRRTTNARILAAWMAGWALLGAVWVRCAWLQVLAPGRYRALAASQHADMQRLAPRRGAIYDRQGQVLAISVISPSVYADPARVGSRDAAAQQLAGVVRKDAQGIARRLAGGKRFAWVARQLNLEDSARVTAMAHPGIGLREESRRLYPQGRLAAHVLGFVDVDHRGLEGLELKFDGALRGQPGQDATLRDAKGDRLIGPWTVHRDPLDGYDVHLTLDSVVQAAAEDALDWGMKRFRAQGGSIVVMEPTTGEVLAMATRPSFDPNAPGTAPVASRRNRAITDVFEPGSVFKIVTAAALLEEGRVSPEDVFYCEEGAYKVPGTPHTLHDHRPHGSMPFRDVVRYSSNIGTAKAAQRLTPAELYQYVLAFGFGHTTGIDVWGEENGIVPVPARWSRMSAWNIPIGHGLAATPLQLAVMASVVANGGTRVTPHVRRWLKTPDGQVVRPFPAAPGPRVISPSTSSLLQQLLTGVVESGTGQLAKIQGLTVAGKTGTAQKLEPNGRYSHRKYVASFVGFGPVPDSRFVIVVSMDEPRPLYFGGVVAAPMFKRVVERLASYWDLPSHPVSRVL
jgi:cell division protein FtsI (penicillin-binding protein 3)